MKDLFWGYEKPYDTVNRKPELSMHVKGEAQKQRILLMESIILWEGRLNNGRLRELAGLSSVRASEWIREFRKQHPNSTTWDSKTRSYHATHEVYRGARTSDVRRQDDAVSLARYLALVGIPHVVNEPLSERNLWSAFPELSIPKPRIFALVTEAIRTHRALQITYRSMREPIPHQRTISPHSLIRAGRRWHTRAFCSMHQNFRDYALGRIENTELLDARSEHDQLDDTAWATMVPVRLIAHPELSPDQESLIRFEYFNNTAARVDTCRGALVGYFIQDIRAATNVKKQRPPDYQLAIANIEEVRPWLFPE